MATALDLYPSQISRWEQGLAAPTHAVLRQLVQLYQTSYDFVYDGVHEGESYAVVKGQRDQLRATFAKLRSPQLEPLLAEAAAI